jgi:PAS domain-containing protein
MIRHKLWLNFSSSSFFFLYSNSEKAVLAIVKDITARKKVLFDLADSEKRFRTLFNSANEPAFVARLDGNLRFENFIEVNERPAKS